MKRLIMVMFFLFATMGLAEEKQMDEILGLKNEIKKLQIENAELKELEKRFIILEATMNGIEKERMSSVDYHEKALEDSKEYYKNTLVDSKNIFEGSLTHIYWFVGIVITLVGFAIAILQMVLRWDSRKKLAKEKEEIEEIKRVTLDELNEQKNYIGALEENLKRDTNKANDILKEKLKEVDKKLKKIDKQTAEVQANYQKSKINTGIAEALSKKEAEEKYKELKKLEEEVKDFDEKFKESLYFEIGYFSLETKNENDTIKYNKKVIDLNNLNGFAHLNRGVAYINKKQWGEALDDFNKAIEIHLTDVEAYNNRGVVYFNLKKIDKALEDYKKVIELYPKHIYVYNNRAELFIYLNKFDEALEDLVKQKELHEEIRVNLEVTRKNYEDFVKFIEAKANKKDLENEVLRRFKAKAEEGIIIVD